MLVNNKNKFETVDSIMDFYLSCNSYDMEYVIYFVLIEMSDEFFKILVSTSNKPSKYDLDILQFISSILSGPPFFENFNFKEILEIYKNRKTNNEV